MAQMHEWSKDEATGQYVHQVSVTVNAPLSSCFEYWSNFESFPAIMTYITRVTKKDENTWHWEARVSGMNEKWDAVMTEFRPNELISWQSVHGLKNSGTVRFEPEGTGCRITVQLMYDPPLGFVGDLVAERRVNDEFHAQLRQDLLNFKHAVETGQTSKFRRAA